MTDAHEPTADEKARHQREYGDGTAVYGEVGESDEQADVHQGEAEDEPS